MGGKSSSLKKKKNKLSAVMETTIRLHPFIAGREDLLAQNKFEVTLNQTTEGKSMEEINVESDSSDEDDDFYEDDDFDDDSDYDSFYCPEDKKNLVEGLEETHVENITREEIKNMTEEELIERQNRLLREVHKAELRGDWKRAWELYSQHDKLLNAWFNGEILQAQDREDWKRARELRSQQYKLLDSFIYLDDLREEEERKIQKDAEKIKKETEIISQKPDSDPQVVKVAEFVRNMTEDILEQKENLQLKNSGLGKTSGVKKEHILGNASVKESCRDVKIYLTQVARLVQEKTNSLPEDVRKKLDSLMASFQKLLKGMWRLLVIVLILYELEKLIVSFKVDGACISHKKGRLKYGFEMAAVLVLWLSHDVETNPGPASDRTQLEKVVRKLSEVLQCQLPVDGSLWSESVAEAAYAAGYSPDCNWTNPSGKNKDSASRLVARAAELGRLLASMECLPQDLAPYVFDLDKNETLEKLKIHDTIETYKAAVECLLNVNNLTAAQTNTIRQQTCRVKKKLKEVNQQHKLHLPGGLSESSRASEFAELADSNPLQFDDPKKQTLLCVSPAMTVTAGGTGSENVLSHAGQNGESGKSSVQLFELENLMIEDIECTDFSGLMTYVDGTDKQIQKPLRGDYIKSKSSLAISQIPTNSTRTHTYSLAQKGDHTGVKKACSLGNKYDQLYQHNNENNSTETHVDDNSNSTSKWINPTRSTQELNPVSQMNSKQDKLTDDVPIISKTNHLSVNDTYNIDGPNLQIPGRTDNWINHGNPDLSERIRETGIETINLATYVETDASERIIGAGIDTMKLATHTGTDASEGISRTGINTQISATHTVTDTLERVRGSGIDTINSATHTVTDASERIGRTGINTSNSATHTDVTDGGIREPGIDTINSATQTVTGEDSHDYPHESVDENANMLLSLSDYIPHDTPELHAHTLSAGGRYHKQSLKELKSSILVEVGHLIDRRLGLTPLQTQITSSGCSIKPKCGHSSQSKEDANEDTRQRRFTDSSVGMTYSGKRKLRHSDGHAKKRKDN